MVARELIVWQEPTHSEAAFAPMPQRP
jgi:hypothetical protein